ncbi:MAG TPA: Ig-like domain-containing protein, partial [Pseudobdellovibrionaceae bacterium]|nr:Ig-like domain-containing protein [Pseudobdellovibrionaceae bacterium]
MKKLKDHQQTLFLLFIFVFFALTDESFAAQVTNFTPTDSAKNIQTVTARFSTDVVPLGDPRVKEEPFSVRCNIPIQNSANPNNSESPNALKYTTRWADTKNWVLEFATPLSSGVSCTFHLNRKVLDVAGNKLDGADEYRFSTSGPRVMAIIPSSGERIQPDQYFVIQVDGSVDPKSINAFAYFEASDLADKLRVKIVEPPLRDSILRAAIKSTWRWSELRQILDKNQTKPLAQIKEFENFVVITSERRFQEKSRIKFQWPANIRSKTGLVTGTSESFEFKVVDPFIAEFSCERTAAERPCNPILDMYLRFSQPVMLKSIKGAQLVAQDGKKWIPEELTSDDPKKMRLQGQHAKVLSDEDLISNLTFKAPFPSSSQFKIILPEQLKDDSGRALENKNKFPLSVQTDIFSPLLKFSAAFGILELKADPILPVSVRNIEKQMSIKQVSIEGKSLNFSKMEDAAQVIKWYRN